MCLVVFFFIWIPDEYQAECPKCTLQSRSSTQHLREMLVVTNPQDTRKQNTVRVKITVFSGRLQFAICPNYNCHHYTIVIICVGIRAIFVGASFSGLCPNANQVKLGKETAIRVHKLGLPKNQIRRYSPTRRGVDWIRLLFLWFCFPLTHGTWRMNHCLSPKSCSFGNMGSLIFRCVIHSKYSVSTLKLESSWDAVGKSIPDG